MDVLDGLAEGRAYSLSYGIARAGREAADRIRSLEGTVRALEAVQPSALKEKLRSAEETIESLSARLAEAEKLRSALERLRWVFGLVLSGKPCRDVEETLAEVNAALATGRVKEVDHG